MIKQLNLAALFLGGKDSTYAIYQAQKLGHKVMCLITISPHSAESHLLHHVNISKTNLQAHSMRIPQILIESDSDDTKQELQSLKEGLAKAKKDYSIDGVVHGGILSEFQKSGFESAAREIGLGIVAPIWKKDQRQYMNDLVDSGFEFIITSVSCDGLDDSWLGKKITKENLDSLVQKSEKYKFNLSFEGGEAETFVVNCPLFSNPIQITESQKNWDGYRGRFEILHAKIKDSAR